MTLSERLRVVRGQLGQVEFAKRIGSSQTGVSAYEKGQRKPDYETLIRVSKEFGVTLDWLLLGAGPMYKGGVGTREAENDEVIPPACEEDGKDVSDSRTNKKNPPFQHIENKNKKNTVAAQNVRLSEKFERNHERSRTEKIIELQDRLLSLTEQNAELRLQLQARDTRIRDLEKENAQLREARKGNTYSGAGIAGSAS